MNVLSTYTTGTVEQTKQWWKPLYKIEFEFLKPNYLLSNNVQLTLSYSSAGIIRQDYFCHFLFLKLSCLNNLALHFYDFPRYFQNL